MYTLKRTSPNDPDFQTLTADLDKDLAVRDGDDHAFYAQFNKSDTIRQAVVIYDATLAVGCGAIKPYNEHAAEVKRMYVPPAFRGKGIASLVLTELETWAKELGYTTCVLETGIQQPEAIRLYTKNSYRIISNYGQYAGVENSVCFEKSL